MADATTSLTQFLVGLGNRVVGSVDVNEIHLKDGVTAPTATVGVTKIFVDVADGDLKVIFGDGFTAVLNADS
jgi:hypothetical protein